MACDKTKTIQAIRLVLAELTAGVWRRRSTGRRRHTDPRVRDNADARAALVETHFALHEVPASAARFDSNGTPYREALPRTRHERRAAARLARSMARGEARHA